MCAKYSPYRSHNVLYKSRTSGLYVTHPLMHFDYEEKSYNRFEHDLSSAHMLLII